ncbi:uncharacterized protein LOC105844245 [Hydra vulgaris]|uniref:uncharacterized protein LOC105844245 n=1 Tax=Hydra vulgaris TaxID=6087 RepID=UPI001F5F23EB|nr:uncharacterized protein LOC105844245 isoform X1 [Hydra vulgaris]
MGFKIARTKTLYIIIFFFGALFQLSLLWSFLGKQVNLKRKSKTNFCFRRARDLNLTKNMLYSWEWHTNSHLKEKDNDKFHVVTYFAMVASSFNRLNMRINKLHIPSQIQYEDRQREIENTLQNNLNNPLITNVHIIIYDLGAAQHLANLSLKNSSKLVLHLTCDDPSVESTFEYIQRCLMNKTIIIMHMDISLGTGWDLIKNYVLKLKVMYALTRHSISNSTFCDATNYGTCDFNSTYSGSHDAFVFHMKKKFDDNIMNDLDQFKPTNEGSENVLIWHFINTMGYKVLNPCRKVIIYHNHCIPIRSIERTRVDRAIRKTGLAPFTDQLF